MVKNEAAASIKILMVADVAEPSIHMQRRTVHAISQSPIGIADGAPARKLNQSVSHLQNHNHKLVFKIEAIILFFFKIKISEVST